MRPIDFSLSKSIRKPFVNNDFLLYVVPQWSAEYTKFKTQPYAKVKMLI